MDFNDNGSGVWREMEKKSKNVILGKVASYVTKIIELNFKNILLKIKVLFMISRISLIIQ